MEEKRGAYHMKKKDCRQQKMKREIGKVSGSKSGTSKSTNRNVHGGKRVLLKWGRDIKRRAKGGGVVK